METERITRSDEQGWRALLGRKVSVRLRLADDPAHGFTEAIGIVQSVMDERVKIVDRRGEVSEFEVADFVAGKVWT